MLLHLLEFFILFSRFLHISSGISCHKDLKLNWTTTISDSPVVSAPLLVKSNNNLHSNRLVVVTHDGSVSIINTDSGHENAQWPVHFPEKAFFAGPLMYDIDEDGAMDIILTSSDGEILFLSWNGTLMASQTIVLPQLLVKRRWNILSTEVIQDTTKELDLSPLSNTLFISLEEYGDHYRNNLVNTHVPIDTHILSTPVIGDFNGDGINTELIIPVNFYFDDEIKKDPQRLKELAIKESEVDYYLASGLIVVDLRTKEVVSNVTFELTMKSSHFPAYLLSSPIVADLDGSNGEPEAIIGSMSGKIHVYNKAGKYPQSFELSDSISGQIAVGDVNNDGVLDIVAVDKSANVICYSNQNILWEVAVSGTATAGAQLEDIDQDGKMEVVIATNDGYVWVLDGQSGEVLPNWPLKLGDEIYSTVLFTKNSNQSIDLVVMCAGNLNIIGSRSSCLEAIPTDEISYVPVISVPNHSFIVSTNDGTVLSFKQQSMNGTRAVSKETGISFTESSRAFDVVTSSSFNIEFEIYDKHSAKERWQFYTVIISFSTEKGIAHHVQKYDRPGVYSVTITSPPFPKKSYILLELCNQFKYCTQDIAYVMFHSKAAAHLVIYVMLPFLVMVCLLLVFHGYPEGNLLPTWESSNVD